LSTSEQSLEDVDLVGESTFMISGFRSHEIASLITSTLYEFDQTIFDGSSRSDATGTSDQSTMFLSPGSEKIMDPGDLLLLFACAILKLAVWFHCGGAG